MPGSTGPAIAALEAVVQIAGGRGGALFEQADPGEGDFRPTASIGMPASFERSFPGRGLLPRWLRVNRQALPIPDQVGVVESLEPQEREALTALGATLTIPLLDGRELVAWAAVSGAHESRLPELAKVNDAARHLKQARVEARAHSRREAVSRSQRLSVAGQMAAGIAHEVRNPLSGVRSMVQLLRNGSVPETDQRHVFDQILSEVDRANRVLSGILHLGRPAAASKEAIDLARVASAAVEFCGAYAKARGQILDVVATEPLWIDGDPHELRQVLINLVLNACQASASGATTTLEARRRTDGSGASVGVVRIMDTGQGIPAHLLSRVFEPFYTTKHDGGGLGLAICLDSVRRHDGNIVIHSEPLVGTTVSVEIPLRPSHGANPSR